ncbi:MAG: ATP-grasp domain-containing protein, partial [Massilioclostridium sp.]|nr:ATP-grasp domain-containing protein [Massilioclostridium sp.]
MAKTIDFLPVLLGSDVNVYGMARSFHEEYGIASVAIGKGRLNATSNSKIVSVEVVEPNIEDDKVFCNTLISFAKRYAGRKLLLVPCGDNYIKLLVRNQDKLRDYYEFECIDEDLLLQLSLKENFYKVCTEHGFAFPKTASCTFENYKTIELPFDFPVIIKPSNSVAYWNCSFPHKKKVFVAYNKQEFDDILNAIYGSSYKDHLILQEY